MNHADDSLILHLLEIDPHEVVMREVDHAVARARASQQRLQNKQNAKKRQSHSSYDSRDESALNKMKRVRFRLPLPLREFVQRAAQTFESCAQIRRLPTDADPKMLWHFEEGARDH